MSGTTSFADESAARVLVDRYLTDLRAALADRHPREREETLAAVEERIEDVMQTDPDSAHVREVLQQLGSVDEIAASLTPMPVTQEETLDTTAKKLPVILIVVAVVSCALFLMQPLFGLPLAIAILLVSLSAHFFSTRYKFMYLLAALIGGLPVLLAAIGALFLL